MTVVSEMDLRGSGTDAREGLVSRSEKGLSTIERILELFETGHQSLAIDLLRTKNNAEPDAESLSLAVEWEKFLPKREIGIWFSKVIQEDSDISERLVQIFLSDFSNGDISLSSKAVNGLLKRGKISDGFALIAAETVYADGQFREAMEILENTNEISSKKGFSELYRKIAKSIDSIDEQADAWISIEDRIGIVDEDLLIAASRMYSSRRYHEVIRLIGNGYQNYPHRDLNMLLSRAYFTIGEYQKCLEVSRYILDHNPDFQDALNLVIRSKRRMGDYDDEENLLVLKKSLKLGTILPDDAYRLSRILVERGEWKTASLAIDFAFESKDYSITNKHVILKSKILTESEGDDEARRWLMSNNDDGDVVIMRALASVLHRLRMDEEALEIRRKILNIDSSDIGIRRGVCTSLLRLGRLEEALIECKKILDIDKMDARVWDVLIETLAKMGKNDGIDEAWSEILAITSHTPDGLILGIEVCLRFDWTFRLEWIIKSRLKIHDSENLRASIHLILMERGRFDLSEKYEKYLGRRSYDSENIAKQFEEDLDLAPNHIMSLASQNEYQTETLVLEYLLNQKMKVKKHEKAEKSALIISSSLNAGGAERQALLTAMGVNHLGWDATVGVDRIDFQNSNETLSRLADSLELNIIEFRDPALMNDESGRLILAYEKVLSKLKPIERERCECIIRLILKTNASVIHAWQDAMIYPAALACMITGSDALIGSVRSLNPDEKTLLHGSKRPFLRKSLQMLVEDKRFFLLNNSQAGRESYSRWLKVPEEKIGVVWNGVIFDEGSFTDIRQELGISPDATVIGGVFRLVPEKRPLLWVDSVWEYIKKMEEAYAIIIGEGRMRNQVEERISKLGANERIILCGFRDDSINCYNSFDATLLVSSTEGLPNVLIESQSKGVPVITTDVGGARETIEDGVTGILLEDVEKETVKSSISIILKEWDNKLVADKCKNFVRSRFEVMEMARKTCEAYEILLSRT